MDYVNAKQVADVFKITQHEVKKLVREGMPKYGANKYNILECVQWYIEKLRFNIIYANITEIAELIGKTERYVNKLTSEKNLPKESHGKYHRVKFVNAYIKFKDEQIKEAKAGGETASDAKTRMLRDQADLKHLEKLREINKVVPVDVFEDALMKLTDTYLQSIDSIPYKNAAKLFAAKTKKEIIDILNKHTVNLRNELARQLSILFIDTTGYDRQNSKPALPKSSGKGKTER